MNRVSPQYVELWSITSAIIIVSGLIAGHTRFPKNDPPTNQLTLLFIFFWIPATAAWFNPFGSEALKDKLHILAAYFFAAPILSSGFLAYPLLLLAAVWLYRPARIKNHTTPFSTPLISFWQSLALPLPRLNQYLSRVFEKDIELGYKTLRTVQTQSFQGIAARKAAQLVLRRREGLVFAGYLAIKTNPETLGQLLFGPPLARSVAILATANDEGENKEKNESKEKEKEVKRKEIQLFVYEKHSQTDESYSDF